MLVKHRSEKCWFSTAIGIYVSRSRPMLRRLRKRLARSAARLGAGNPSQAPTDRATKCGDRWGGGQWERQTHPPRATQGVGPPCAMCNPRSCVDLFWLKLAGALNDMSRIRWPTSNSSGITASITASTISRRPRLGSVPNIWSATPAATWLCRVLCIAIRIGRKCPPSLSRLPHEGCRRS